MNWVLDHPWHVAVAGGLLALMIGGGWVQTGRRSLLALAIAIGAIAVVLVLMANLVVTERARVEQTLRMIAADVESNDVSRLVRHISLERPDIRQAAQS